MTLRSGNNRSAEEGADITQIMPLFLGIVGHNRFLQGTQSLLSANNSSLLPTGRSFNMSNQIQKSILIIAARGGEVGSTTQLISSSISPQGVHIVQQLLLKGLCYLVDKVVEINTTRQNTIHLLIDTNSLQSGRDSGLSGAAQALTPDTLSTIGSFGNNKHTVILNDEDRGVALGNVTHFSQSIEVLIALQTFNHGFRQNLLDQSKQTLALAVTNVLVVQVVLTVVLLNQSLA